MHHDDCALYHDVLPECTNIMGQGALETLKGWSKRGVSEMNEYLTNNCLEPLSRGNNAIYARNKIMKSK